MRTGEGGVFRSRLRTSRWHRNVPNDAMSMNESSDVLRSALYSVVMFCAIHICNENVPYTHTISHGLTLRACRCSRFSISYGGIEGEGTRAAIV